MSWDYRYMPPCLASEILLPLKEVNGKFEFVGQDQIILTNLRTRKENKWKKHEQSLKALQNTIEYPMYVHEKLWGDQKVQTE